MNLRGTRALITGASSGIGWATAEALAREGVALAVCGRRIGELAELAESIVAAGGNRPVILRVDLAQPGAAAALAEQANAALGGVDLLVNCAAVEGSGSYSGTAGKSETRELFEINYWSPMALVRALLPQMRARGRGAIVNVSSLGAITPIPETGHYPSAKAALSIATEALRAELRGSGVQVVLVYPGLVDTPMFRAFRDRPSLSGRWRQSLRLMPVGSPETLGRLIVTALRRGRTMVVYPRSFALTPYFPSISRRFTRFMFPAVEGNRCSVFRSLLAFRRCCVRTAGA